MAISFKSTIFKCKPGMLGTVNIGDIVKMIGKDLGPGVVVNSSPAVKLLKKAQDGRKNGNFLNAVATAGIVGSDMVFAVEGGSDEEKVILVKDYAKAKAAALKAPEIVNAQVGDRTIDKAAKDMKKAKGGTVIGDDEALNVKGDKAPIVVLAHGGSAESKGKVYAKDFAGKSPKAMFEYLSKTKKLPQNYAGTLYLDGCFTASGKTDANYAKLVYAEFLSAGYKYMKVVGNLGAAATLADGRESVLDAQEEKRLKEAGKKKIADAKKNLEIVQKKQALIKKVWDQVVKRHVDEGDITGIFENSMVLKLKPELKKLAQSVTAHNKALESAKAEYKQLKKDFDDFKYDIVDLIGSFGPAEIRQDSRFKSLFS